MKKRGESPITINLIIGGSNMCLFRFLSSKKEVNKLISNLKNENVNVRWKAVGNLAKLGQTATVALINALENNILHASHADYIKAVFERIGNSAVEPLIKALYNEIRDVRLIAAETLEKIGDARAIDPLIYALKDRNFGVRSAAASALGEIGDERAVEPLIIALEDTKWCVRMEAANALGKLGDERAIEPLHACYNSHNTHAFYDDEDVAEAAKKALLKIDTKIGNNYII